MAGNVVKRFRDQEVIPTTSYEVLRSYAKGKRDFKFVELDGADFSGADLTGCSFYCSSMRGVNFSDARLTHVQLKAANLTMANLEGALINATDLIGTNFHSANLKHADLTGACLSDAYCGYVNLSSARLNNATVSRTIFENAKLNKTHLSNVHFSDTDVTAFCNSPQLVHVAPSNIDSRTVMRSHSHPNLRQFMVDCGVPEVFATYMIDCARALEEPLLRMLMQSTFISYGARTKVLQDACMTPSRLIK
jgi:hypothetical protein